MPQSTALLALPGVARDDPDWYAALVMNHILGGGGQQSRLFTEVREKRGLAYGVVLEPARLQARGAAGDVDGVANERVAEALRVVKAELARLRVDGPTEQEIADAKTYLSGALALSLDSSGAIAGLLHSMQVDDLAARPSHQARRPDRGGQARRCPPPRPPPVARRGADHGRRRQAGGHHVGSAVSKIPTRQYLSQRRRA